MYNHYFNIFTIDKGVVAGANEIVNSEINEGKMVPHSPPVNMLNHLNEPI